MRTREWKRGWMSGYAAGDGCFYFQKKKNKAKPDKFYSYFCIASNDHELLDYFEKFAKEFQIEGFRRSFPKEEPKLQKLILYRQDEVARLKKLCTIPTDRSEEFKKGWSAGIFDAEGSGLPARITSTGKPIGWRLFICQSRKANPDKCCIIERFLRDFGFAFHYNASHYSGGSQFKIRGGIREALRFYNLFRPFSIKKFPNATFRGKQI